MPTIPEDCATSARGAALAHTLHHDSRRASVCERLCPRAIEPPTRQEQYSRNSCLMTRSTDHPRRLCDLGADPVHQPHSSSASQHARASCSQQCHSRTTRCSVGVCVLDRARTAIRRATRWGEQLIRLVQSTTASARVGGPSGERVRSGESREARRGAEIAGLGSARLRGCRKKNPVGGS